MKVVINTCFGGFGLSYEAAKLYAKKKGFELFYYRQTKYHHRDNKEEYTRIDEKPDSFCFALKKT